MASHDDVYRKLRRQKDLDDAGTEAEFFCANCKAWLDLVGTCWVRKMWHEAADEVIEDMYCDDCIDVDKTRLDKSRPPSE